MIDTSMSIGAGQALAPAAQNASAAGTVSGFSSLFRKAVSGASTDLEDIFSRASEKYGVPVNLLKAVAKAESGFRSDAVSSCGAQGIMQLMPSTARSLGVENSFDPEQNVMGGAKYLSGLLDRYGDPKLALAAYNAGSGNVKKYGGIPPFRETQNYVRKVMGYAGEDVAVPGGTLTGTVSGASGLSGSTGKLGGMLDGSTFTDEDYAEFLRLFAQQMMLSVLGPSSSAQEDGEVLRGDERI